MAHAKLSPSAAHRWMNCPGSIALIGDDAGESSQAAMMGTAAHKIIQVMGDNKETDASPYHGKIILVKSAGDEETEIHDADDAYLLDAEGNPRKGWFAFVADEKMINGVQIFVDEVERLKLEMHEPEEINERFLDMSWLDDRLGGTADKTLVEPFGWAHLLDYKNGFAIVEVKDNEQLKNYGVGILHEHPDAEGVRISIVQPNAPHIDGVIRTVEYTRDELKIFEIQLKEAADETSKPNAPRRAGDWCYFCPAKTRCDEFAAKANEEAGLDFADDPPPEISVPTDGNTADDGEGYRAELARKALFVPLIDKWAREIETLVQNELVNGKTVPGFKLVEGKSNRKWSCTGEEFARLIHNEIGSDAAEALGPLIWTEPKFKSPAQVEKLGDKAQKKEMKALVAQHAFKPPGRLTVAEEVDPRPAASITDAAIADFAGDPITSDGGEFE